MKRISRYVRMNTATEQNNRALSESSSRMVHAAFGTQVEITHPQDGARSQKGGRVECEDVIQKRLTVVSLDKYYLVFQPSHNLLISVKSPVLADSKIDIRLNHH
ncbi:hypothetical protein ACFL1S_02330 [Pseudomonadota bacterium]